MKWRLVLWVAMGVTAATVFVRTYFGLPVLVPALATACIATAGGVALSLALRSRPRP